jgi:hypothetical protein
MIAFFYPLMVSHLSEVWFGGNLFERAERDIRLEVKSEVLNYFPGLEISSTVKSDRPKAIR